MMLSHTMKKGDTLWDLARHLTGDGRNWKRIAAVNGIDNARRVRVGTKIFIPADLHRGQREFARMDREMGYPIDPGSHVYNLKSYGQQRNSGFLAEPVDRPEYGKSMGRLEGPKNRPEYGRSIGRLEEPREHALEAMVLRMLGRGGDTEVGHLTPGEIVVPRGAQGGGLRDIIRGALKAKGYDFERYEVGGEGDSRNPMTGAPEFNELTDVYDPGFINAAGGTADQTLATETAATGTEWGTPTGLQSTAGMLPSGEYMAGWGPQGQIASSTPEFNELTDVYDPGFIQQSGGSPELTTIDPDIVYNPMMNGLPLPPEPNPFQTPSGGEITDETSLQAVRQAARPAEEPRATPTPMQQAVISDRARDAILALGGQIGERGIMLPDFTGRLRETGVNISELDDEQPGTRAQALADAVKAGILGWGIGSPDPSAGPAAASGLVQTRALAPWEVQASNVLGKGILQMGAPKAGGIIPALAAGHKATMEGGILGYLGWLGGQALSRGVPGGNIASLALGAARGGEGSVGDRIGAALSGLLNESPAGLPPGYAAEPANFYGGPGTFVGQSGGEMAGPVSNQPAYADAFLGPAAQQAAALSALVPNLRNAVAPNTLSFDPGMSDLQRRAQIATYGTQGQGSSYRDITTQRYYRDLLTNAINQAGMGAILPVEWQYLAEIMGIPQMSTQQALLEAIASV